MFAYWYLELKDLYLKERQVSFYANLSFSFYLLGFKVHYLWVYCKNELQKTLLQTDIS